MLTLLVYRTYTNSCRLGLIITFIKGVTNLFLSWEKVKEIWASTRIRLPYKTDSILIHGE